MPERKWHRRKGKINKKVKAILVGVSDYSTLDDVVNLPLSKNDVDVMGRALTCGLRIDPCNIWINHAKEGNITTAMFLEGIRLFMKDIEPDDILILYFSGHGFVDENGRHCLLFSDGPLETQSVIDLFSKVHADKRILFLDCCMSGKYGLSDRNRLPDDFWIDDLLDGGTAVFASSRPEEMSGYYDQVPVSLFTGFLWNAMMNRYDLDQGNLTLDRIRELVYAEADAWNERHPDRVQHPVFRSSIAGIVSFPIAEYHPYQQKQYSFEGDGYIIVNVSPLYSQIAKRYDVKVILKHAVTEGELVRINEEIVRKVRPLNIFKSKAEERRWKDVPASLIFIHYGRSPEDLQGNYEYYTVWADETQNRQQWYRTNDHCKIVEDICIDRIPDYQWLQKLNEQFIADADTTLEGTKTIVRRLFKDGASVLGLWQEYRNGTLPFDRMLQNAQWICPEIDRLYLNLSDLPIPPTELSEWLQLTINVAGDIQELSLILSDTWQRSKSLGFHIGTDESRINETILQFRKDLTLLRNEEVRLKER